MDKVTSVGQTPVIYSSQLQNTRVDPFTILMVEDDAGEVLFLQKAFKKTGAGIAAQFVVNGEEAIDYLSGEGRFDDRASFPEPQLVIMDLNMPRKDGFEVLEWFRNMEEGALVPVIVLTSSDLESDIRHAYNLGANSYFLKPSSDEDFCSMIKVVYDYWALARRPRSLAARR